jgi:anti-sigma regulatory factor (Ser/Thr protein kinase)
MAYRGEGRQHRILPVTDRSGIAVARSEAQRLARSLGFSPRRAAEVAIVVSELASNIVKYGIRGEIELLPAVEAVSGKPLLTVVARDVGPPIHDLGLALQDGYDDHGPIDPAVLARRGGLGTGLGAVDRLGSGFSVEQDEHGKAITVTFSP